jgi:hypothetical protein
MNKTDTLLDRVYSDLLDLTITDENLKCFKVTGNYDYGKGGIIIGGTIQFHIPVSKRLELISEARILQKEDYVEVRGRGIMRGKQKRIQIEPYSVTFLPSTRVHIDCFPSPPSGSGRWKTEGPHKGSCPLPFRVNEHPPEMPLDNDVFPRPRRYYPLSLSYASFSKQEFEKCQKVAELLHKATQPLTDYCQKISLDSKLVNKGETIVYTITPESFQKAAA